MKVPAFSDLGKEAKDLLYGSKNAAFQYDQKVKVAAKASDGVAFTLNTTKKGEKVASDLKAAYDYEKYSVEATVSHLGKVGLKATVADLLTPGLKLSTGASVPYSSPAKLTVGYSRPHLNVSSSVDLGPGPKVDASLTTGHADFTVGGDCSYDTGKGGVDKWALGAGYTAADYQVGLILGEKGEMVKAALNYKLNSRTSAATEVRKNFKGDASTLFTAGISHRLENGSLVKTKVDSNGIASCLWQQDLDKSTNVALSGEADLKHLEKSAKVGVSFEING